MSTTDLLLSVHGPVMSSNDVQKVLHFRTVEGFRTARRTGRLKLEMFRDPGRRGLFAETKDVAAVLDAMVQLKNKS